MAVFDSSSLFSIESLMVVRAVIPCLAIIYIGYLVGGYDRSRNEKTLSSLIYFVFSPAIVFSALHKHPFALREIAAIGSAATLLVVALYPVASCIRRRAGVAGNGYMLAILFMSSGAVLLPLALLLFGNEGLAKAVMFHLFSSFLFFTAGCWLADGRPAPGRFFRTPTFVSAVIGMTTANLSLQPPEMLWDFLILAEKGVDIISLGALPLLLIGFGYPLSNLKRSELSIGIHGGLTRMIAAPVAAFLIVYIFREMDILPMEKGYNLLSYIDMRTTEAVIVLASAMPGAMSSYLSNQWRGSHVTETLAMLVVAAMIGIVSIPVVLYLINVLIFSV